MLKAVFASLLAGAGTIVAGLYLVYAVTGQSHPAASPWVWDLNSGRTEMGRGESTAQGWKLTLDPDGRGVLVLPLPSLEARAYPVLNLRFSHAPAAGGLGLFWGTTETGGQMAQYWVPGSLEESLWLPMGGMSVWDGKLVELAVLLQGEPGAAFVIESLQLLPASPLYQLRAFYSDWTAFVPWGLASINRQDGTRSTGKTLYPLPVIAAWLGASLLLYGLFVLFKKGLIFDWRVVSAIFLVGWLGLDLVWQGKLWQQLSHTRAAFAGKDDSGKLASGPDAALVQFITYVQQRMVETEARIFVASSSDYLGMRANYYLYPMNVYWHRHEAALPAAKYIHSGDYIVLVNPTDVRFDRENHTLLSPGSGRVAARILAESDVGSLYRAL